MRIINILGALEENTLTIVNGLVVDDEKKKQSAIHQILSLEKAVSNKPFIWKGYVKGFHFIQGQLSNKDGHCNKMSFSFCSNESSDPKTLLIEDLRINGFQLDENTNSYINKKAFSFLYIVLIIIIIIAAIILFVLSKTL